MRLKGTAGWLVKQPGRGPVMNEEQINSIHDRGSP